NFEYDCSTPYFTDYNNYCDGTTEQTGVIAQELQTLFPSLVQNSGYADYLQVNYDGLAIYTLKGVAELANFIDDQGNANFATLTAPTANISTIMTNTISTPYRVAEVVQPGDVVTVDSQGLVHKSISTAQTGL